MLVWIITALGCRPECAPRPVESMTVEIVDPTEQATLDAVGIALAEFQSWYPYEEICVSSISVQSKHDATTMGTYNFRNFAITVDPDTDTTDARTVVRHELCHAADATWDLASPYANLFLETEIWDKTPKRHADEERFAYTCDLGPRDQHRWRLTEEICGEDYTLLPLTGLDFIRREVYQWAPVLPWGAPSRALEALPAIRDDEGWSEVAASGAHLVEIDGDTVLWRDRATGEVDITAVMPGLTPAYLRTGSPGPYLWSVADGASWYAVSPGRVDELPGCEDKYSGAIVDGVLWEVEMDGDAARLVGCDLFTGEILPPILAPDPPFPLDQETGRVDEATPVIAGASVGLWYRDAGLMWQTETGAWDAIALPWYFAVVDVDPTLDGTGDVLLTIQAMTHETVRLTTAFAWVDVSEASTETSPLPCLVSDGAFHPPEVSAGDGWFLVHDDQNDEMLPYL